MNMSKFSEVSKVLDKRTDVPFRPPGKIVVVLSNISLSHPEKGDIVNIRPSTKILNLAVENLLSVGSFKLLF